jgi:putative copper export protein
VDDVTLAYEALPKALVYLGAQLATGIAVTRWLLAHVWRGEWPSDAAASLQQHLGRFARLAATGILISLAIRAWAHTAVVFSPSDAMQWEQLRLVALDSRWGQAWRLQVLAAIALVVAALACRTHRRAGWVTFTVAAVVVCATIPLLGHAAGSAGRLVLHASHLAASGAWLGTLAAIVVLHRVSPALHAVPSREEVTRTLVDAFSSVALPCAAVIGITGLIAGAIYLGGISPLVTTAYGWILLTKLTAFAGVLICGWINWRTARGGGAFRRPVMLAELTLALVVVLLTSVLTETEHP